MGEQIAILTPTFCHFSGIDRVVELQAKELCKKGNNVTIVCLKASIKSKYAKVIEIGVPKNSTIERIYRLFMFLDVFKISKYAKFLKKFDIVISHLYPMNLIASNSKKKYGIKFIYHNHGIATPSLFNFIEKTYLKLFNLLNNISIRNCTEVWSISKYIASVLKKETKKKSKIVYDPINTDLFNYKVKCKKSIKSKYKCSGKIWLYVGRISPHKGVEFLIRAFNKFDSGNDQLIIVGKPTFDGYFKKLKSIASMNVKFVGFVPDKDLPSFYALCDVYTTCTLWEGFDMPIVEANACGKPAVCFDIGPHKEVLKNGGLVKVKNILNISEKEISDFADRVRDVL